MNEILNSVVNTLIKQGVDAAEARAPRVETHNGVPFLVSVDASGAMQPKRLFVHDAICEHAVSTHDVAAFAEACHSTVSLVDRLSSGTSPKDALHVVVNEMGAVCYARIEDGGTVRTLPLAHLKSRFTPILVSHSGDQENAIIYLRRAFVNSNHRNDLLALISNLASAEEKVVSDNGLSQVVTTKVGVMKSAKTQTKEVYHLIPHAPFPSLDYSHAPSVEVFVRIEGKTDPRVSLVMTNASAWHDVAENVLRKAIIDALGSASSGKIRVI